MKMNQSCFQFLGVTHPIFIWSATVFFFEFFKEKIDIFITYSSANVTHRHVGGAKQNGSLI